MTIVLTLPERLEQQLKEDAERLGLSIDEYAIQLLEKNISQNEKQKKVQSCDDYCRVLRCF